MDIAWRDRKVEEGGQAKEYYSCFSILPAAINQGRATQ